MTESVSQTTRVVRTYRQSIDAAPDVVFPLLCPIREAEWLDGWQCAMIHSASGLVEQDAVFSTSSPGEEDTIWLVTRHDPAAGLVEFARFTPHSRTCMLRIAVSPCGEQVSHVDISYAYTSLGSSGDQFLHQWTEEKFLDAVVFWEQSMNHFLKARTQLKRDNNSQLQTESYAVSQGKNRSV